MLQWYSIFGTNDKSDIYYKKIIMNKPKNINLTFDGINMWMIYLIFYYLFKVSLLIEFLLKTTINYINSLDK